MKGPLAFAAIAAVAVSSASAATHAPIGRSFVGTYQADCRGTGPSGLKGEWKWSLEVSHQSDEGGAEPQSLYVYESGVNSDHIWLMSFSKIGQGPNSDYEKAGEACNIATYNSKIAGSTLFGTLDSGQYVDPDCKIQHPSTAPLNHAGWKSDLTVGVGEVTIGTYHLAYQGYDPKEDPNYEFTCQLMKAAPTANQLRVESNAIHVSVQTQLWTEDNEVKPGTLEQLAPKWEKVASSYWNNQNILVDGKEVRFDFKFVVAGTKEKLAPQFHHIEIINGAPNSVGTYCAYVQRGDNTFGPHEGTFPLQLLDPTLGHEVGHLMNLADEYEYFGSKEEIPSSVELNGQTLFPIVNQLPQFNVWDVAYALKGQKPGLMSQKTPEINPYYVDEILKSLGYSR